VWRGVFDLVWGGLGLVWGWADINVTEKKSNSCTIFAIALLAVTIFPDKCME